LCFVKKNIFPNTRKEATMAPKTFTEPATIPELKGKELPNNNEIKVKIVWRNVVLMAYLHMAALYGFYLLLTRAKWETAIFAYILYIFSGLGITAGSHRLWSHRSYKAKWPLRLLLALMQTMAFENDIYEWCRDHRVHHKYSETDADPHNAKRGFFFSHVGWLLCRKHPDVITKGKLVDLSDLWNDPIVRFQRKFYLPLVTIFCFIIPTYIPFWLWRENLWNSFFICALLRYAWTLNMTWFVINHRNSCFFIQLNPFITNSVITKHIVFTDCIDFFMK
jgi:stearoyl-CoA desaturase (delta-9 desaturase)